MHRRYWYGIFLFFSLVLLSFSPKKIKEIRFNSISLIPTMAKKQDIQEQVLLCQQEERKWSKALEDLQQSKDPFYIRRARCLAEMIARQRCSLPASIIFNEPGSWNHFVWVNVGKRENHLLGKDIVKKNSPVVVGKVIVGVVEKVKKRRSLVRLITDPMLTPSVRIVRGQEQNRIIYEKVKQLIDLLNLREDLGNIDHINEELKNFIQTLGMCDKELYLAKGEMRGAKKSLWRRQGLVLEGVGFQYDFADEEGPSRDLRCGMTKDGLSMDPLIKVGDLLVTTGMDGVFPPDYHVGIVSTIYPLHEGGCSYSLEAHFLIPDLCSLKKLSILPPQ